VETPEDSVRRQIPGVLWIALVGMGLVCCITAVLAVRGEGRWLAATAGNVLCLFGLSRGHRWAYVATVFFCSANSLYAYDKGADRLVQVVLLDGVVLGPVLLCTTYYFPNARHRRRIVGGLVLGAAAVASVVHHYVPMGPATYRRPTLEATLPAGTPLVIHVASPQASVYVRHDPPSSGGEAVREDEVRFVCRGSGRMRAEREGDTFVVGGDRIVIYVSRCRPMTIEGHGEVVFKIVKHQADVALTFSGAHVSVHEHQGDLKIRGDAKYVMIVSGKGNVDADVLTPYLVVMDQTADRVCLRRVEYADLINVRAGDVRFERLRRGHLSRGRCRTVAVEKCAKCYVSHLNTDGDDVEPAAITIKDCQDFRLDDVNGQLVVEGCQKGYMDNLRGGYRLEGCWSIYVGQNTPKGVIKNCRDMILSLAARKKAVTENCILR